VEEKKQNLRKRLLPLIHLWPGVLTLAVVAGTLPFTAPVLSALPQRLTAQAEESVADTQPAQETEEVTEETLAVFQGTYEDGTYTGTAQGYGGPITVEVTVAGGKITDVQIVDSAGETDSFFRRAVAVVDQVLTYQTWEVDTVSGATYSSRGILAAIQNALTGEAVKTEAPQQQEPVTTLKTDSYEAPSGGYADGTYTGTATGFGGDITVSVTIQGGKISAVSIVSAEDETPSYFAKAQAVTARVVAANSPNVDTVSGATYSSNGILNAVKRALAKAGAEETPVETEPVQSEIVIAEPQEDYQDGLYLGTGEGYGGDITVRVTIREGRIAKLGILSAEDETPAYFSRAKTLLTTIQTAQSTNVDVISGATYSSEGILEAVNNALSQAVVGNITPVETPAETPVETPSETVPALPDQSGYADGTYTASALCTDDDLFSYTIGVTLTIEGGKITQVSVEKTADQSDDPDANDSYLSYAIQGRSRKSVWYPGIPAQIVDRQSADGVDAVSGATYSSRAVGEAAQAALNQAKEAGA
jgi:uncharacterized protein with FMN-binding domain